MQEAGLMNHSKLAGKGFTLIELLVVIAIIAILAAILFPIFVKAKESGRCSACQSNMKQINTALMLYIEDYGGRFPSPSWSARVIDMLLYSRNQGPYIQDNLAKYVKNDKAWMCPSVKPNQKIPAFTATEDYSIYTWADNRGTREGRRAYSNYMWIHIRATPSGYIPVSGRLASDIVRTTKATMFFELPYWSDPPHFSSGGKYSGHLIGGNVVFFDGHVKLVLHNYQNAWAAMSNEGWVR